MFNKDTGGWSPPNGWGPSYGSKAKIYGASWNKTSSPTLTRTDKAVGMVANAGIDAQVVTNNFDTAEIYRNITEVTDTYGNVFVRIPKFYIKKTDGATKTWQISRKPFAGAYLPWCFWDFVNSRALPYIDIGKYKAGLDGSNRLTSKPNEFPLINKTIIDFRTYAKNNNSGGLLGYQQLDIHVRDVLETLFIVEFATLNSQSVMQGFTTGQLNAAHTAVITESNANRIVLSNANASAYVVGQTIAISSAQWNMSVANNRKITAINTYDASNKSIVFDGAPANVTIGNILHNMGAKNGETDLIVAKSGSPISNIDGKRPCKYRGIESPWGDTWQWVDGLNIDNNRSWVCKNAENYASNLFANPYEQLGYLNKNAEGWASARGFDANNPFAEITSETLGGSSTFYSDYYYQATGQRVALVGGSWSNDAIAGLFYWYLNVASGSAYIYISGRLLKKPL